MLARIVLAGNVLVRTALARRVLAVGSVLLPSLHLQPGEAMGSLLPLLLLPQALPL